MARFALLDMSLTYLLGRLRRRLLSSLFILAVYYIFDTGALLLLLWSACNNAFGNPDEKTGADDELGERRARRGVLPGTDRCLPRSGGVSPRHRDCGKPIYTNIKAIFLHQFQDIFFRTKIKKVFMWYHIRGTRVWYVRSCVSF